MCSIFLLFCILTGSLSCKFLVYNPLFGHSHTTYLARIADTLYEAGHEVTVFSPLIDDLLFNKTGLKSGAKLVRLDQDPRTRAIQEGLRQGAFKDAWTMSPDPLSMFAMFKNFSLSMAYTCDAVASNTEIIEAFRAEKFDVGIAEPFSMCGFGLFDHLGIASTIAGISTVHIDSISYLMGEPLAPSYVPNMMSADGDEMTFMQRFTNAFGTGVGFFFLEETFGAEAKMLTEKFGKDYTNYGDIMGQISFSFANSNPYLNFPRPLLHKTIEIGGISVDVNNVGELGEKWDKVLNERPHSVFISFGSMAKSKDMPEKWRKSIISLCESMPEVTFIWKYEEPTTIVDHLPNVHLSPWLPQNALLADRRLSLFITHGGLGSTNEVAHFGKPSVMIPLFGDQIRNTAMLARHGGALIVKKEDLGDPEILKNAVEKMLNEKSFAEEASRLSDMLRSQPVSAKDLVVSHAEFLAQFGPLTRLDPYGRHLNILQYYLVDVIAVVLIVAVLILYSVFYVSRLVYRKLSLYQKVKQL